MKIISQTALAAAIVIGATILSASSVAAYGGCAGHDGAGGPMGEGSEFTLVPQEMREQFRQEHADFTDAEQEQFRAERRAQRDENQSEREAFFGLSHDEMREAHQSGKSMSEILSENGKTRDDATAFLTQEANQRVDEISSREQLDTAQTTTLRERIPAFVNSMLQRWFE